MHRFVVKCKKKYIKLKLKLVKLNKNAYRNEIKFMGKILLVNNISKNLF